MVETKDKNPIHTWKKDDFFITTEKEKLNLDVIYHFLIGSYWAKQRTFKQIVKSIENSLCFGLYDFTFNQAGFARIITDYSTFAYLADVFILPEYQQRGLGKWLIDIIFSYTELKNIDQWILITNDAHKLYERVGFCEYPYPKKIMVKKNTDPD